MPVLPNPKIIPLGDSAILVRFSEDISADATQAVVGFTAALNGTDMPGVLEVVPNLVSVLVRYAPQHVSFRGLTGEIQLLLARPIAPRNAVTTHAIPTRFGGAEGPDLNEVAQLLGMTPEDFIMRHNGTNLRVLATGFAPGFVYCGLHDASLHLPRRSTVRDRVPAGSILFAAGQTAITSTPIPTGWHVIGQTEITNFDSQASPPTHMRAGDIVRFEGLA